MKIISLLNYIDKVSWYLANKAWTTCLDLRNRPSPNETIAFLQKNFEN